MNKFSSLFKSQLITRVYSNSKLVQLSALIPKWTERLKAANEEEDINYTLKCIAAHVINKQFTDVKNLNSVELTETEVDNFERLCECRVARMPIQYILGEWDFLDLNLKMSPTVFIPRPETEDFVKLIMKDPITSKESLQFLEVGCGTGAISLSLLNALETSNAVALDRSKAATDLTNHNAKQLGLSSRIKVYRHKINKEQYFPELLERNPIFDLIVSNPPYVKTCDLSTLSPEIKFYENLNALDGGPDGLDVARLLCSLSANHLKQGGKLWMELDSTHPSLLKEHLEVNHSGILKYITGHKDCFGLERFIEILKV